MVYPFGVKVWIYGPSTESVSYELRKNCHGTDQILATN